MEFDVFRTKNLFEMTRYDFREEIIQFPSDDPVDRYYIYKAIGIAETDNDLTYQDQISGEYKVLVEKGEADRSELLKDIYQHIFFKRCGDGIGNDQGAAVIVANRRHNVCFLQNFIFCTL